MRLLTIDTSSPDGSIAYSDGENLVLLCGDQKTHYSSRLYAWLEQLRTSYDVDLATLEGIVICQGPGTFTGLRIGLATAKGLAMTSGARVVAFDTLEVIATAHAGQGSLIRPCLNAGRGEICTALFEIDQESLPVRLEENRVIAPEEITAINMNGDVLAGSGTSLIPDYAAVQHAGGKVLTLRESLAPAMIRLARARDSFSEAKADEYPELNYVRAAVS